MKAVGERAIIIDLERQILHGGTIDLPALYQFSSSNILSSPLISKVYGAFLVNDGRLQEGMQYLSSAIKGLAAQGLHHQMLEAIASLAILHLRTGNLVEARTILVFLQEEYTRKQTDPIGLVAHALAKGAYLIDDFDRQSGYIQAAIDRYAHQGQLASFGTILLDLYSGLVPQSDLVEWSRHVAWLQQKVKLSEIHPSYFHYILGMQFYDDAKWAEAISAFDQIDPNVLGYFYTAIAQVYRFRSRYREASMKRLIEAAECHELIQMLEKHEVDLELSFYAEIIKFEWYTLAQDHPHATEAKKQASIFQQLTELPYQERILEKIQDSSNQKVAIHIENTDSKNYDGAVTVGSSWRIYCFGKMQLINNGRVIKNIRWKRKKTLELFTYLLFQTNYTAPRDRVIEILFGDSDTPDKLSNRLYVSIHELRQVAKTLFSVPNGLIVQEGIIRLNEHMVEYVDVEQYMTLVRVGEQLWRKDRDLAFEMFEQAAQLFGDLLPEVSYIDWLDQFREQLIEQQSLILHRLTKQCLTEQQYDQAEWYIIQWLRMRPLQEEVYYAMIHLLLLQGRRSEALQRYHQWEQICHHEFGVTPSPEIQGLILENVK